MDIVTIAELLRHVEEFEDMLADFYSKLSHETNREGVRMLCDYISRHRQRTHKALFELQVDDTERMRRICNTPLRYKPDDLNCDFFAEVKITPDVTGEEVLEIAMNFDENLIDFYHQVVQRPVSQEIKTLFENLILWEENDKVTLKRIKSSHYF